MYIDIISTLNTREIEERLVLCVTTRTFRVRMRIIVIVAARYVVGLITSSDWFALAFLVRYANLYQLCPKYRHRREFFSDTMRKNTQQ